MRFHPDKRTPDGQPWPLTAAGKPRCARKDGHPNNRHRSALSGHLEKAPDGRSLKAIKCGEAAARYHEENPNSLDAMRAGFKKWAENNAERIQEITRRAGTASALTRKKKKIPTEKDYLGRTVYFKSAVEREYFLKRRAEGVKIRSYYPTRDGWRLVYYQRWREYTPDFIEVHDGREVPIEIKGYANIPLMIKAENARYKGGVAGYVSMAKRDQHPDVKWIFIEPGSSS